MNALWARVSELAGAGQSREAEKILDNIESEARALLNYCGLDWHPDCLEFHRSKRIVFTASNAQVRQPLYSSSVGRWRHYEGQRQ